MTDSKLRSLDLMALWASLGITLLPLVPYAIA